MAGDPVAAATDPGEAVHWRTSVTKDRTLGALAAILVALFGWPVAGWLLVEGLGLELSRWLVVGALGVAILAGYGTFRVLAPHHVTVTYAATDRRLLAVPESDPDGAESIPWADVDAVTVPPARHGQYTDGICVRTDDDRLTDAWAPLSCSMYVHPVPETERAYRRLLAARRTVDDLDPTRVDPDRVQWATSRAAVSDRVEAFLAPDESVHWHSRTDERGHRTLTWVGVAVLGPFAFAVAMVVAGVIVPLVADPLPLWPSVLGAVLFAAGSVGLLVRAQRRWYAGLEYVATDRRLFATRGDTGEWDVVSWEDVTDVERFNDTIRVHTSEATLQFDHVPDAELGFRHLRQLRDRQA